MANSLEVRVPFLDHRVVELAQRMPADQKTSVKQSKHILRESFKALLPSEIYKRGKHGFEVPLLNWFRTGLKSMITEDLLGGIEARLHVLKKQAVEAVQLLPQAPSELIGTIRGITSASALADLGREQEALAELQAALRASDSFPGATEAKQLLERLQP